MRWVIRCLVWIDWVVDMGMKKRRSVKGKNTLCWSCGRFSGRCSWSANFEPVKGWKARKDILGRQYGDEMVTYTVDKCPLYEKDSEDHGLTRIQKDVVAEAL